VGRGRSGSGGGRRDVGEVADGSLARGGDVLEREIAGWTRLAEQDEGADQQERAGVAEPVQAVERAAGRGVRGGLDAGDLEAEGVEVDLAAVAAGQRVRAAALGQEVGDLQGLLAVDEGPGHARDEAEHGLVGEGDEQRDPGAVDPRRQLDREVGQRALADHVAVAGHVAYVEHAVAVADHDLGDEGRGRAGERRRRHEVRRVRTGPGKFHASARRWDTRGRCHALARPFSS
jgi:hypothetical protein